MRVLLEETKFAKKHQQFIIFLRGTVVLSQIAFEILTVLHFHLEHCKK